MKCNNCEDGLVYAPIGEHFVSADMAMDAGMPEIVGASMGVEWGWAECDCCHGNWNDCATCQISEDLRVWKETHE